MPGSGRAAAAVELGFGVPGLVDLDTELGLSVPGVREASSEGRPGVVWEEAEQVWVELSELGGCLAS